MQPQSKNVAKNMDCLETHSKVIRLFKKKIKGLINTEVGTWSTPE